MILGVSRSGTTLLKEILDHHPDVAIPPESYFVTQLWDRHGARPDPERFVSDLGRLARLRDWIDVVERYLFDQGDRRTRFFANVARLPLNQSSTFVRSVTRDISRRLGIPLPDAPGNWWSVLSPIRACLEALANGRLQTYPQLFEIVR